jgi:hypothetical protein
MARGDYHRALLFLDGLNVSLDDRLQPLGLAIDFLYHAKGVELVKALLGVAAGQLLDRIA